YAVGTLDLYQCRHCVLATLSFFCAIAPYLDVSTPSIRIVGRVADRSEQFLRRRIDPNVGMDESDPRPNNRHFVAVDRVRWLTVDELECSRCSVARCLPDEYSDRIIDPRQPCPRQSSIDL